MWALFIYPDFIFTPWTLVTSFIVRLGQINYLTHDKIENKHKHKLDLLNLSVVEFKVIFNTHLLFYECTLLYES